jgi:hypothetical protein
MTDNTQPLTPEVTHALEDLDVPIPQPVEIDFDEANERANGVAMVRRWLKGDESDFVPDDLVAEISAKTGARVINSDEDLRNYVEDRGYALVPLNDLGKVQITKDGPRLKPSDAQHQTSLLAEFLLSLPDFAPEDEGAGEAAIRVLQEQAAELENLRSKGKPSTGGINPKDAIGMTKPDLSLVPSALTLHTASAMMDGAAKYGPYNWRANAVLSMVYISAALRHINQYLDGEDVDPISGVHHLGHAAACMAIMLDAQETGNLSDNRPMAGAAGEMVRRWSPDTKFKK